jgi:hypothetical protein
LHREAAESLLRQPDRANYPDVNEYVRELTRTGEPLSRVVASLASLSLAKGLTSPTREQVREMLERVPRAGPYLISTRRRSKFQGEWMDLRILHGCPKNMEIYFRIKQIKRADLRRVCRRCSPALEATSRNEEMKFSLARNLLPTEGSIKNCPDRRRNCHSPGTRTQRNCHAIVIGTQTDQPLNALPLLRFQSRRQLTWRRCILHILRRQILCTGDMYDERRRS